MIWARVRPFGPHGFIISCIENAMKKLMNAERAHDGFNKSWICSSRREQAQTFRKREIRASLRRLLQFLNSQLRAFWSADFPVRSSAGIPHGFEKRRNSPSFSRCCGLESPRSNLLLLLLVAMLTAVSAQAASAPKIRFDKTIYD